MVVSTGHTQSFDFASLLRESYYSCLLTCEEIVVVSSPALYSFFLSRKYSVQVVTSIPFCLTFIYTSMFQKPLKQLSLVLALKLLRASNPSLANTKSSTVRACDLGCCTSSYDSSQRCKRAKLRRDVRTGGTGAECRDCRDHTGANGNVLVEAFGCGPCCLSLVSLVVEFDAGPSVSVSCNRLNEYRSGWGTS